MGFHGTSAALALQILQTGFTPSTAAGEWLGHGVYFWDSLEAAWLWADQRHRKNPAVLRATILLGYCIDLDSSAAINHLLRQVHRDLEADLFSQSRPMPTNVGDEKFLDCAVLNLAATSTYPPAESIVRTCPSGPPVYPGTGIQAATQRQICVRNIELIRHPHLEPKRS